MKLDFRCSKCGARNYEVKNIVLPEKKNKLMKVELNVYYAKTCLNCGYTEFYSAKIVDEELCQEKDKSGVKSDVQLKGSI